MPKKENPLISVPYFSVPCSSSPSYIVRPLPWSTVFTCVNLEQNREHKLSAIIPALFMLAYRHASHHDSHEL